MSTRANVIIKDSSTTLYFYRHSDGYPECTGESLKKFCEGYASKLRADAMQSAGWLVLHGHSEYHPKGVQKDDFMGWKVGAYEPCEKLHGDVEYIWVVDLERGELQCHVPHGSAFWDEPDFKNTERCKEFKTHKFKTKD